MQTLIKVLQLQVGTCLRLDFPNFKWRSDSFWCQTAYLKIAVFNQSYKFN